MAKGRMAIPPMVCSCGNQQEGGGGAAKRKRITFNLKAWNTGEDVCLGPGCKDRSSVDVVLLYLEQNFSLIIL
jgi:hypothetical protein